MAISTAVDSTAVARTVGIKTTYQNLRPAGTAILPQRVALIGQGASAATFATTKLTVTSAKQVGAAYGYGSPLHLAAKQLFPKNGDGVGTIPVTVYPLDDAGSAVTAAGDITPAGTATTSGTFYVVAGGIVSEPITVGVGDTVADLTAAIETAVNAVLDMPIIAADNTTVLDFTAKWAGTTGNDIVVSVEGPSDIGLTFAITQATSGATDPDVQDALDLVGNVWETMVVSCFSEVDTTTFNTYQTWNEGRWGAGTYKPAVVFTGSTVATLATAYAVSASRKLDYTNSIITAPGSTDLPCMVAARAVARIVRLANNDPAHDYGRQIVDGITAGDDDVQWTYTERDLAVKNGCSTSFVEDGVIQLGDIVTFYHPDGEDPPAYRYVVDIVKIQNVLYSLSAAFNVAEWDGAPMVPDGQFSGNPSAKKPSMAKAVVAQIVDTLADRAILSDPVTIKESIQAEIDAGNPKRMNIAFTMILSGNTNIISIDNNFGFYFGV